MIYKKHLIITFIFLIICLFANHTEAQTYYGKHGQGKFVILNDSIGVCYFNVIVGIDILTWDPDTCRIRKNFDTLFITTINNPKMVHLYPSNDNLKIENVLLFPAITLYSYSAEWDDWMIITIGAWSDSIQRKTFVKDVFLEKGMYVMKEGWLVWYDRYSFVCDSSGRYDIAIDFGKKDDVVLDEMPLLIKGKNLVPINDSLQIQCWAENGFFFPRMQKRKKSIGCQPLSFVNPGQGAKNLPANSKDMSFLPKKYLKYLRSTY